MIDNSHENWTQNVPHVKNHQSNYMAHMGNNYYMQQHSIIPGLVEKVSRIELIIILLDVRMNSQYCVNNLTFDVYFRANLSAIVKNKIIHHVPHVS